MFDRSLVLPLVLPSQHIKPVSFTKGEVIFRKGELSRELLFLIADEIHVASPFFDRIEAILTPEKEARLSPEGTIIATRPHSRTFGESVIINMRRPATYVANAFTETLQARAHTQPPPLRSNAAHLVPFHTWHVCCRRRLFTPGPV